MFVRQGVRRSLGRRGRDKGVTMTILVTGSTGHVGRELIRQLVAVREPVRAMTRRPGSVTFPQGVEIVYGDCENPASLDTAFRGIQRAFLMSGQAAGSARRPTHDLALAAAARGARVDHVVKLSVYDGGRQQDALGRWHREAEAAVTESGIDWTLLRPGRFMSNTLSWASMIRSGVGVHLAFAHRPAAAIAPADIAAVAATALTTDGHRNLAYQLSGPELLTPVEELRILADVLERPLTSIEVSLDATRAGLLRAGMSEAVVEAVVGRVLHGEDGTEVLPTVERLLSRPPITFGRWAREHGAAFLDARRN